MNEQDQNQNIISEVKFSFSNTLALLLNARVSKTLTGQQIASLELLESMKKAGQEIVLEEKLQSMRIIARVTFDENGVHRIDFKYAVPPVQ